MPHTTEREKNYNYMELNFITQLDYPLVVKYYDTFKEINKKELWLLVEYLDGGSLHEATKRIQVK